LLGHAHESLMRLTPADPCPPSYLLCIAQWVDLGYGDLHMIEELIERFSDLHPGDMRMADYLRLRMMEAFRSLASEDVSAATSILEFVLQAQPVVTEPSLIALAHFWKAGAHRRKGEYKLALYHVSEAKRLAQQLRAPKLVALIEIHESWLLFQRGQRMEAFLLLDRAEAELKPAEHALSLGNIESARGPFVRRSRTASMRSSTGSIWTTWSTPGCAMWPLSTPLTPYTSITMRNV
jgi:ATP/maltotriose-dependent transcriptional regulator MalT